MKAFEAAVRSVALLAVMLMLFVESTAGKPQSELIASVGGRTITTDMFVRRYSDFILSNGIRDSYAARSSILTNMIHEELLLHFDESGTIRENDDFLQDVENARRRSVLAYLKDREVYGKISVSEAEAREAFSRANEILTASHLYARSEEEAEELSSLLRSGVPFEALARSVFTDSTLRENGGFVGDFTWGDMDPAFEDAAYSLNMGDISAPVKTSTGYSIIRLEHRAPHPLLTESEFLRKKAHLMTVLRIRKKGPAERRFLQQHFSPSAVRIDSWVIDRLLRAVARHLSNDQGVETTEENREGGAEFGGRLYDYDTLRRMILQLARYQVERIRSPESARAAVMGVILQDVLLRLATQKGYDTLSAVTEATVRAERALYLRYRLDEIARSTPIDEPSLRTFYREHLDRFSSERELNVREIIVGSSGRADSLLDLLRTGSSFESLARTHSHRDWSAINGGEMGYAPGSRYGHFRNLFWRSEIGALLGPLPVGDLFGIFIVIGKKESLPVPFAQVRDRVHSMALFERRGESVRAHLDRLKMGVEVNVDESLLRSLKLETLASR